MQPISDIAALLQYIPIFMQKCGSVIVGHLITNHILMGGFHMSQEQAKVHISLREGVLELQGSEDFVSSQLQFLEPLIRESFKVVPQSPPQSTGDAPLPANVLITGNAPGSFSDYDTLFADADGKVQILKNIPGGNKAIKSVNAALLLAYANTLKGIDATPYSDVRDLCSSHACLDSGNFSKQIKAQKELFIVSGSGSAQTIKLTVPGKKKGKELADGLK